MSRLSLLPTILVFFYLFSYVTAGHSYLSRSDSDLSFAGHKRSSFKPHKHTSPNGTISLDHPSPSFSSPTSSPNSGRKRDDVGTYLGCYYDSDSPRVLSVGPYTLSSTLTTATCVQYCESAGYAYAGTEYGVECWCSSQVTDGALVAPESDCSQVCSGDGELDRSFRFDNDPITHSHPCAVVCISTRNLRE